MSDPSQRTFDFDRISLSKCLSVLKPKPLKTLFRGLLLTAAEEPWRVDDIDDDGVMILSATHEKVAQYAGCVKETIMRNHREQNLVTHNAGVNSMSQWMFNLRDALPSCAVWWFRDLVENSRVSARRDQNVRVTFPKCQGDISASQGDISQNVTPNVRVTFRALHEQEHEYKNHEFMNHEALQNVVVNEPQKSQGDPAAVRFSRIRTEHVRQIVQGFDAGLFEKYFADAIKAGWAKDCSVDRVRMAALFHQVVRRGQARSYGGTIAKSWKRRSDPKHPLQLIGEDEDFGRRMEKALDRIRHGAPAAELRRTGTCDGVDSEAEARRQEKLNGQAQIAALNLWTPNRPG